MVVNSASSPAVRGGRSNLARPSVLVKDLISGDKEYIDYAMYAKHRRKLKSL